MIDESTEAVITTLRGLSHKDLLLVGMGNSLKADDGIGPEICSILKSDFPDNIIDTGTVPENYIQVIIRKSPKVIVFVDAIDFGGTAGEVRVFNSSQLSSFGISTHALSPRLLCDMIMQSIKAKIYFIGIQPKSTVIGEAMSREVESARDELVELLKNKLFDTAGQ